MERDEVPCEYGGRDAESGVGVVEEHMGIGGRRREPSRRVLRR